MLDTDLLYCIYNLKEAPFSKLSFCFVDGFLCYANVSSFCLRMLKKFFLQFLFDSVII